MVWFIVALRVAQSHRRGRHDNLFNSIRGTWYLYGKTECRRDFSLKKEKTITFHCRRAVLNSVVAVNDVRMAFYARVSVVPSSDDMFVLFLTTKHYQCLVRHLPGKVLDKEQGGIIVTVH
jgi:hypothetical protein